MRTTSASLLAVPLPAAPAASHGTLPPPDRLHRAIVEPNPSFDGTVFAGVHPTGLFCRPTCPGPETAQDDLTFFARAADAHLAGYRPCPTCRPMEVGPSPPPWVGPLLSEVDRDLDRRWTDRDLTARGLDPTAVRGWFQRHHGLSFHAWHRRGRVGRALATLEIRGEEGSGRPRGSRSGAAFRERFGRLLGSFPLRGDGTPLHFARLATPLGPMLAAASSGALRLLEFADRRMLETQLRRLGRALGAVPVPGSDPALDRLEEELGEYFAGARHDFTVPLDPVGTPFQLAAWQALRAIPRGETRSYGEQARILGRPGAARAVARANGANALAILVPCHRLVGASGDLVGYGGGVWRKGWLLAHEGADVGGVPRRP